MNKLVVLNIICIVVFFVCFTEFTIFSYKSAKCNPMMFSKDIIIINNSMEINTSFSCRNIIEQRFAKRLFSSSSPGKFLHGGYDGLAFWLYSRNIGKIRRGITLQNFNFTPDDTIFCGSFTGICEGCYKANMFFNFKKYIYSIQSYPGSLINNHVSCSQVGALFCGIGGILCCFKCAENKNSLEYPNNCQNTSKNDNEKLEPPKRVIWWERILASLFFLGVGIYFARNGINYLLCSHIILGWFFLIVAFLCGQLAVFTLRYGLFEKWF